MRGVQIFNERMLSRWRDEGFVDLVPSEPPVTPTRTLGKPHKRDALAMLQRMLAIRDHSQGC